MNKQILSNKNNELILYHEFNQTQNRNFNFLFKKKLISELKDCFEFQNFSNKFMLQTCNG